MAASIRRAYVAAALACAMGACIAPIGSLPVRSRSISGSDARPAAPAPTRPAPLALPKTVDVVLSTVDAKSSVTLVGRDQREITVSRAQGGVVLAGSHQAPASHVWIEGPVRISGVQHGGDLRFMAGPKGGLRAVARLPLETYVAAVVSAEIPLWSAEPAELESQAIAARTFAIQTLRTRAEAGENPELLDGVLDQAYRGSYVPAKAEGSKRAAARLAEAVTATAGQCLMRGDSLEEARYHASCGGHTASFDDIFTNEVVSRGAAGPIGVRCASCERRARKESAQRAPDPARPLGWITDLDPNDLAVLGKALGLSGRVAKLFPVKRDRGGRWLEVQVQGPSPNDSRRVTFEALRKAAGYSSLKSANIATTLPRPGDAIPLGASLRLQGRGRGHGVGLCQESMRELAQSGWTSQQILRHYYPGTRIVRLPEAPLRAPQP